MPVLRAEVARGVAVAVLGIHVRSLLQKRVDHVVVATNAGHVQWRAHCLGPAVQVTPVLGKDLDQVDVPLIRSDMEGSPAVAVALVEQRLSQLSVLAGEDLVAGAVVSLLTGDPYVPEELFLVPALLLRQEVTLAHALLRLVYKPWG